MAYSAPGDLLMGKIPLPSYIDPQKVVDDAADEMDSKIGFLYQTPVDINELSSQLVRPARLLLKRINNNLATGRLILAIASPEENKNLHAYGWALVTEATKALECIAEGEVKLDGAPLVDTSGGEAVTTPLIDNLDAESNVEAFYDRLANPNYVYGPLLPYYRDPDKLVP